MRLTGLFLRSRLAGYAALCMPVIALFAWAMTLWLLSKGTVSVQSGGLVPVLVYGTLAAACVIGVSANSPFGEIERTTARPLMPLRLGHMAGLLLCVAPALAACLIVFDLRNATPTHPFLVLVRNVAGLTGFALLTARLFGAWVSWASPLAFVAVVSLAARRPDGTFPAWAWQMQPGDDGLSWAISLALFLAGLALICLLGARDTSDGVD